MKFLKEQFGILFLRNYEAYYFTELFFINAGLAIVTLRVFLSLTGYPQVGNDVFHIAHELWGGLALAIALGISLFFLDRPSKIFAVILGGIGFGVFIDELGKFITADNNYFYQPTLSIIYLIFIGLFLFLKHLGHKQKYTKNESLVNTFEMLKSVSLEIPTEVEKERLFRFLKNTDIPARLKDEIVELVNNTETTIRKTFRTKFVYWINDFSQKLVVSDVFKITLILCFLAREVGSVLFLVGVSSGDVYHTESSWFFYGLVLSSLVVSLITIGGLIMLFRSYHKGLVWFYWSLFINIFVLQFFAFYFNQLEALFGLVVNIILYYFVIYSLKFKLNSKVTLPKHM